MRLVYRNCNVKYAGVLSDSAHNPLLISTEGYALFKVGIIDRVGTLATGVLAVQGYSNPEAGQYADFTPPIEFDATTKQMEGYVAVDATSLAVRVTTGEGSDVLVDVMVELIEGSRSSGR